MIITQLVTRQSVGIQDSDKVRQQQVGTEWRLFVEHGQFDIAAKHPTLAESTELVVAPMLAKQLLARQGLLSAIAQQPDITLAGTFEHGLERQGHRAAMLVASPRIIGTGIGQHLTYGAASARHIPDGACDFVEKG